MCMTVSDAVLRYPGAWRIWRPDWSAAHTGESLGWRHSPRTVHGEDVADDSAGVMSVSQSFGGSFLARRGGTREEHHCPMLTGSFPGVWWQPENPDKRIAGVLSLDYEGLGVDLIGSFGRLEDMGRVTSYPVLHGTPTGGLFVTLMNAVITNESLIMSALGLRSTRLQPGAALIGGLIDDPHGGAWPNCSVELERMTAWASPPGFEHSLESRDGSHLKGASFRYDVPPSVELRIPGATLSIGPSQTISGDLIHEAKMAVTVDANFRLDRPATIEEIYQRFLKPLLNLVVLATQKPTSIITISLAAGDEAPRKWVEVVSRRPSPASEQRKRLLPMDALFLLPDLLEASADGVGLWYAAADASRRSGSRKR